jgi:hypothetical protein
MRILYFASWTHVEYTPLNENNGKGWLGLCKQEDHIWFEK